MHAACPDAAEAIKWGMPAFLHRGRPLANMAAFSAHVTFGFWDRAALATGHTGVAMGWFGRIMSPADLPEAAAMEALITGRGRVGRRRRPARAGDGEASAADPMPPEFAAALANDTLADATFFGVFNRTAQRV